MSSGCIWWAKRQLRRNGAVVVLTFHRVLGAPDYRATHTLPGIVVRARTFHELVVNVVRRYEPVGLQAATPGEPCKKLRVAFTFDDGWNDTYTVAFPLVRAYNIPLTVFICPELVGRDAPFWPEQVVALLRKLHPTADCAEIETLIETLKRYTPEEREQYLATLSQQASEQDVRADPSSADRTLSWREIEEMDRAGVLFGCHTQTHQILTRIPEDMARHEVQESKIAIERALSKRCDAFAYPNGNFSPQTRRIVGEMGFRLAVTTELGAWTATSDLLAVPRSNICEDNIVGPTGRFSPAMFEYGIFWKTWRLSRCR